MTEALWSETAVGQGGRSTLLCHAAWPQPDFEDEEAAADINWLVALVSGIRSVRSEMNVPPKAVAPLVLVGAGGTLAELYKDFVLRMAPVSEAEALEMIGGVKGLAPIRGYRNLPRGDLRALAFAIPRISFLCLLEGRPVAEAEINPLIVKADGVVAVDALLALKGSDAAGRA